ncbi:hypothetical protein [Methanohalophilus sp. RSK]|uniref:hypothetical protein n=1 Tax=Methanohalophilus sp. RSK TaxID=2485783 RepID=UPI001313F287|nr:hypothetical protein [Methanohalophilus sp. RSK]
MRAFVVEGVDLPMFIGTVNSFPYGMWAVPVNCIPFDRYEMKLRSDLNGGKKECNGK